MVIFRCGRTNSTVEWASWSGSQAGGCSIGAMETCLRALPAPRSLHLESLLLCSSAFTHNAASKAYFHDNIQLSKGSLAVSRSVLHSSDRLHASGRAGATLEGGGDVASPVATLATELLYKPSLMCKPAQAEAEASPAVLTWLAVKILLIKYTLGQLLLPQQYAQQSITYFNTSELTFLSTVLFKTSSCMVYWPLGQMHCCVSGLCQLRSCSMEQ